MGQSIGTLSRDLKASSNEASKKATEELKFLADMV